MISERSPYLLQHAYNPVDWFPWGEMAFRRAKEEDKPIFLSIGYSTCHWCHVMERESFEDAVVASLMNKTFVSIKVDKEERPDVDNVYMQVCQMMTGSGGWPLTIIMTPDKKPFFAATYIPRETMYGMIGMKMLIPRIREIWKLRRDEVLSSSQKVVDALRHTSFSQEEKILGGEILESAFQQLSARFDERWGGFGAAPKFPTPSNLTFLLRHWRRTGDQRARLMVEKTLQSMRLGGLYDHLGHGFHRYSTDSTWLVPHFEKMLYDQALLTIAYVEGYQATGIGLFRQTAQEVLTYVLRDMTAPEGGFYSAEDADSQGEEGKFYLWTAAEIRRALSPAGADLAIRAFNVQEEGNYTDPSTKERTGRNILHLQKPPGELSLDFKMSPDELQQNMESVRRMLFDAREARPRPSRDEKILTDWNGLMIVAMAKAAQAFNEVEYGEIARRAADFILAKMRCSKRRLCHRFRDGEVAIEGFLDDYAFLIWGLIELYETIFEVRYLKYALDLADEMIELFWDDAEGAFYFTAKEDEPVILRQKMIYDGATPSGNSVAMNNLLRLARMTANSTYQDKAARIGRAFSKEISSTPAAHTQLMAALDFEYGDTYEIVLVGDPQRDDTQELLRALRERFLPNKVVLLCHEGALEIVGLAPYTGHMRSIAGKATAYICRNYACQEPTTERGPMLELLNGDR